MCNPMHSEASPKLKRRRVVRMGAYTTAMETKYEKNSMNMVMAFATF